MGFGSRLRLRIFRRFQGLIPPVVIPAVQTVYFGAKTLRGHGAHLLNYTGSKTLSILSGNDNSHWAITNNGLVLAGTIGAAPPTLLSTYNLVIGDGDVSSTVTIQTVANTYHIAATAADTATSNQLRTLVGLTSLTRGVDTIVCRDGNYNPTSAIWAMRVPAGGYAGTSGTITITSENQDLTFDEYGQANLRHKARFGSFLFSAQFSGDIEMPFTLSELYFYDDTGGSSNGYMTGYSNGLGWGVSVRNCRYECGPNNTTPQTCRAVALRGSVGTLVQANNNRFFNVMRGIVVGCSYTGLSPLVAGAGGRCVGAQVNGNNFFGMREDGIDFLLDQVVNITCNDNFGLIWNFGVTGGHPDFIQGQGNTTGNEDVFGEVKRNVLFHNTPVTGSEIVQGIFMDDSTGTSRYTNAVIENNIIITTAGNGIFLNRFKGPRVRFNTVILPLSSGASSVPQIIVPPNKNGEDGIFTYNATNTVNISPQLGTVISTPNSVLPRTLAAYQDAFASWTETGIVNRETVKAIVTPKVGGTLMNGDGTYNGALKPDGSWNSETPVLGETTTPLARSIDFGHGNGHASQQRALTGVNLTNVFGTGSTGGDAPGAIVVKAAIDKGWLATSAGVSASVTLGATSPLYGLGGPTSGLNVSYYGSDHATAANRNRVVANLRDTGSTTTISLRSAEWLDDDPRTVLVRFDGTNFSLDLVRSDGTLDLGTPVAKSTWKGLASGANVAIGSYNGAPAGSNNYWQGQLSDFCHIRGRTISDSEAIAIGKGQPITTVIPSANIARFFALRGASDLTQTQGLDSSITLSVLAVGSDFALRDGTALSGSFNGTEGIAIKWLIEGYTAGVPYGSPNGSRPLPVVITNTGATATHVQARVTRAGSTSTVHKGWTRITTEPLAPGASLTTTLPAVSVSPWLWMGVRREDNIEIHTAGRDCAVGQKIWAPDGQSQEAISCYTLTLTDTASLDANIPGNLSNVSFVTNPTQASKRKPIRAGILRGRSELSIMMMNTAKRLSTMYPDRVFCFMLSPLAGTGRAEYYQNKVWHSAVGQPGNGNRPDLYPNGTEPYYVWGDDVTPGSGMVTDLLLAGGRDISFFMSMPSVDDSYGTKTAQRMDCLFFGSDMTGSSMGGSYEDTAPTGAPPRYFARPQTGLVHPIHVAVQYHDRTMMKGVRTLDQVRSSGASFRQIRPNLRTWALGLTGGRSGSLSHFIPDKVMETKDDGGHQAFEDPRGNLRMAGPFLMGMLKTAGLSTFDPDVFPTGATLNAAKTAIVVTIALKNGGQLVTRDNRNPYGFEVSTNGGTNWTVIDNTNTSITATNQVTITGDWSAFNASNIKVRYYGYDPANVAAPSGDTAETYAEENDRVNGLLFETRADVVTAPGVAVLPVMTTEASVQVTQI